MNYFLLGWGGIMFFTLMGLAIGASVMALFCHVRTIRVVDSIYEGKKIPLALSADQVVDDELRKLEEERDQWMESYKKVSIERNALRRLIKSDMERK